MDINRPWIPPLICLSASNNIDNYLRRQRLRLLWESVFPVDFRHGRIFIRNCRLLQVSAKVPRPPHTLSFSLRFVGHCVRHAIRACLCKPFCTTIQSTIATSFRPEGVVETIVAVCVTRGLALACVLSASACATYSSFYRSASLGWRFF